MRSRLLATIVTPLSFLMGCGDSPLHPSREEAIQEQQNGGSCLELKLADNGFGTAPPARVSLFFTVDTCAGEPVAGLSSDSFEIYEDGQPVSVYESQRTIQPRGQKFRLYSMVLLDLSGSLLRSGEFPKLRDAAAALSRKLVTDGTGHQVALYGFDGRASIFPLSGFTSNPDVLTQALDSLMVAECSVNADCNQFPDRRSCAGGRCVDDSTNLNGAVIQGLERLDQEVRADPSIPFRNGALVLFTDGTDQAGRVSATETRTAVRKSTHRLFAVGLGGEVDEPTLRAYAKDGYQPASRPEELSAAFDQVASRIASEANRFYFLEYCSPKRGGTHKLEVVAKTQVGNLPLQGKLGHAFDASGFGSGCEVTPLPATP